MAATVLLFTRVLLLGILFTEVLSAGGSRRKSKSELLGAATAGGGGGGNGLWLDIKPRGELLLGRNRGSARLSCSSSDNLRVERVSWLYNDEAVPPCGPRQRCNVQRNGLSLRLSNKKVKGGTTTAAAGQRNEYRCVAHTSYGASLRSAATKLLYAELADEFDEAPQDSTVYEGEVTRMACRIRSVPALLNITWFRDGQIIDADNRYVFLPAGIFFIKAVRKSDAGSYWCEATNQFVNSTKTSKEAKLTVLLVTASRLEGSSSSRLALFPQTSYAYSPQNGTDLLLACAASGYPSSNASWTFVAKYADVGADKPSQPGLLLHSSPGLSLLQLKNLSTEATGTYVCSASSNFASNDSTETQFITVDVLVPPTFIKKPSNQICPNGRTARFECQAQGYPTPRIYWLKNAADITINGRRTVYVKEFNKMELAISATVPSDSGIYQCVAINSAGEIWAAGRLQVNMSRNSPAAPTLLQCEALSPVKIFVSWQPPKFLPFNNITAYTVHYRPVEGGKEEVSPPEPGNSTSVEVTKLLEPFTNYTFYVRLWNNHGASDQSATITCSTNASVPKTAPKIFANVINSSKLNVTWKPLTKKEAQGIVTEYKLEWRLSQHPSIRVRSFPPSTEQYVLTDLLPGEQYDLRVLARTELGWPNVSESQLEWLFVKMPSSNDLIEAQILIVNSTTIKLKWDLKTNSIFQLTSWTIALENEDDFAVASVNLTKEINEYEFTNLESKAAYIIKVCAQNYAENLNCIRKRADLKKIATSNAPTALEAIPLSPNSIGLSWLPGSVNGSNSFEICYNPVHLANESSTCFRSNTTKVIVKNLKPFTLYQFKVRAFGNIVNNNESENETIECYTNEDVPGKVEDIEWFFINSTLVRVAWKQPNAMNGVIQRYYVAYSTDMYGPKSVWNNFTIFGNNTSTSLPTLVPGKRYFVVIQAATKAGAGNPSEPIVIATAGSSPKVSSALDETKPLPKTREDKKLGIILGIAISILSIFVCLCSIYCRRKYESLRSLRESAQPLKGRVLTRNGNACCVAGSSGGSPPAVMSSEIELAVLFPSTPLSTNPLCDTKGGHPNGILESCAKEPLLSPWEMNGMVKDLRITENPQYKPIECDDSTNLQQQQQQDDSTDMNSTQLTTINDDLEGSEESLNNNMNNCTSDVAGPDDISTQKTVPPIVLEPNG